VEGRFLRGLFFPFKLAWSPDAKTLFLREWDGTADCICGVEVESGNKRCLTSPPPLATDFAPAVSPDGGTLAFGRKSHTREGGLYVMPIERADPQRLAVIDGQAAGLAWLPSSRELVFAFQTAGLAPSLWRIGTGGGAPGRLGILGGEGVMPVVSPAGGRLVYESRVTDSNILRYDLPDRNGDAMRPRKIIYSTQLDGTPQLSPQGDRIVFGSARSGSWEIWVAASDGSNQVQLTSMEPYAGSPRWSPDGRTIAFDTFARSDGSGDIYLIDAAGGPSRRLVIEGGGVSSRPSWSQDGKWIYFSSRRSGSQQIWKVPSVGGKPVQITREGGNHPFEAPGGDFVYYMGADTNSVWRVPVDGGEESLVLPGLKTGNGDRWDVTAKGIYYVDEEVDDLSSESRWVLKLLRFEKEEISVVSQLDEGAGACRVSNGWCWPFSSRSC
jgi:Tol biopolymer transport system component